VVTVELTPDHRAPREARRLTADHAAELSEERRHAAVLLVSELVSNSVSHGVGTVVLRLELLADRLRVEVEDQGRGKPAIRDEPGPDGCASWTPSRNAGA
jgi:anti-sigma regulatory factor (Ser/Thr protein kinase)